MHVYQEVAIRFFFHSWITKLFPFDKSIVALAQILMEYLKSEIKTRAKWK